MDNEAAARLKFDRRMANRAGWVEPEELESKLEALPDCADKIADSPEEVAAAAAPRAPQAPAVDAAPPEGAPAPLGTTFGGGNAET